MPAVCPHFLRRKIACRAATFVPICRYACAAEANGIKNGPFYGIVTNPVLIGSIPGIKVDENCRVLDAQNQAIKNLFACGELIFGNLFSGAYVSSGSGVGISAYTGAIAADAVIEELK